MNIKNAFFATLFAFGASPLGGCTTGSFSDLSFASVEAVDYWEQREAYARAPLDRAGRSELVLKISFRLSENLFQTLHDDVYSLVAMAYFCDDRREFTGMAFGPIYWNGFILLGEPQDQISEQGAITDMGYRYETFVHVRENDRPSGMSGVPAYEGYDLITTPRDVCFYVRAGSMPREYISNEIRISASQITEAVRRHLDALAQ